MTTPSATSGELANPQPGVPDSVSCVKSRRQTVSPVAASMHCTTPVAPRVNNLPSWNVGVARGPAPMELSNRAVTRFTQTGSPESAR